MEEIYDARLKWTVKKIQIMYHRLEYQRDEVSPEGIERTKKWIEQALDLLKEQEIENLVLMYPSNQQLWLAWKLTTEILENAIYYFSLYNRDLDSAHIDNCRSILFTFNDQFFIYLQNNQQSFLNDGRTPDYTDFDVSSFNRTPVT